MTLDEILRRFKGVVSLGGDQYKALCPAHRDSNASLSIGLGQDGNKILINCLAGCQLERVLDAVGLKTRDLFAQPRPEMPFKYGLELAEYALVKCFNAGWLREWHVSDGTYISKKGGQFPGVRIQYKNAQGADTAVRWRMCLTAERGKADRRFLWGKGGKLSLYGLWRMSRENESVILVEGESDCHALWHIGANAIGLPGAAQYRASRDDAELEFFDTIYVHVERDAGGKTVFERFAGDGEKIEPSALLPKMRFWSMVGYKDPSEAWQKLHHQPEEFRRLVSAAMRRAETVEKFSQPEVWLKPDQKKGGDGRAVTSPENGAKGGRPAADYIGLAEAYAKRWQDQEGRLTLRHWRNAWYAFNGRCYEPRLESDIEGMAVSYLQDHAVAEAYHMQPSTSAMRNLLIGLRSFKHCGIPAETPAPSWLSSNLPADGWVAMANTVINIEAAARHHHAEDGSEVTPTQEACARHTVPLTPDLLSTFAFDYNYDPAAQCPNFRKWLSSTQPDVDIQRAMLMLMGLALVPDTSYNVCFFLAGEAGTGKSVFLDILEALVSGNVCRVPLLKMEEKFHTWPLAENLLNIVGELPTDDPQGKLRYIEGDFKDTVSGGLITIERKTKDVCTARCTARHVFATNHLPIFFDKSEGIWDRLVIIPFDQRFRGTPNEIRRIQDTIIPNELPGIFNMALWGLAALRRQTRFPEPEACRAAKQYHRDRCDFDNCYLRDNYLPDDHAEIEVSEAYQHYRAELVANGLASRSSPTFQAAVARVFAIRATKRSQYDATRVFRGLRRNFASDFKAINPMDQPY